MDLTFDCPTCGHPNDIGIEHMAKEIPFTCAGCGEEIRIERTDKGKKGDDDGGMTFG